MEKNKNDAKRRYRQELDRQVKMFGEMADHGNGYAREYQEYLIALRDGTLSEYEKKISPKLIFDQDSADHAWRMLHAHVENLWLDKLKFIPKEFRNRGAHPIRRNLNRHEMVSSLCLSDILSMFNPENSKNIIFRTAFPLSHLKQYGYSKDLCDLKDHIWSAWNEYFKNLLPSGMGHVEYPAATITYEKLCEQLSGQFGFDADRYLPFEERTTLFRTFENQLDALSARVFANDTKHLAPTTKMVTIKDGLAFSKFKGKKLRQRKDCWIRVEDDGVTFTCPTRRGDEVKEESYRMDKLAQLSFLDELLTRFEKGSWWKPPMKKSEWQNTLFKRGPAAQFLKDGHIACWGLAEDGRENQGQKGAIRLKV